MIYYELNHVLPDGKTKVVGCKDSFLEALFDAFSLRSTMSIGIACIDGGDDEIWRLEFK